MSMIVENSFQRDIEKIASQLRDSWNINRVVIKKNTNDELRCKAAFNFRQFLPDFCAPFFSDSYRTENRETIEYFYEVFGKRRVLQIAKENDLLIDYKRIHGLALTRHEVEVLFANMGIVKVDTIQGILQDLRANPSSYLHLTQQQTAELARRFREKNFEDLTKADFDELYKVASPFEKTETYFLNNPPGEDAPYQGWQSLEGVKKMVDVLEGMRRNIPEDLDKAQLECDFRKGKKMMSYCLQEGLIFPEPKGYRYVYKKIEGGGAYKIFLKALTKTESYRSQVSYLCTQFFGSPVTAVWESIFEDFKPEIGAFASQVTYDDTKRILYNPNEGFVDSREEEVDNLGYSLGGALAQRDYCLFRGKIRNMIAVNTPAIDRLTTREFACAVNSGNPPHYPKPKIDYIWDAEDTVSYAGETFVGKDCDPDRIELNAHLLRPVESDEEISPAIPERIYAPDGWWETLKRVFYTFMGIHGRETINAQYRENVLSNQYDQVREFLNAKILDNSDYGWEEKRIKIARFLFGNNSEGVFHQFYRAHLPE